MSDYDWDDDAVAVGRAWSRPMKPADFIKHVKRTLKWTDFRTRNAVAHADGRYVYYKEGMWWKYGEERRDSGSREEPGEETRASASGAGAEQEREGVEA